MISVEVSAGDLLDRITILEIKVRRFPPGEPQARMADALRKARGAWQLAGLRRRGMARLVRELRGVNAALWNAEDEVRAHERRADFGALFISVAREICRLNDRRSVLKRQIDGLCGLPTWEEKSYGARRRSSQCRVDQPS